MYYQFQIDMLETSAEVNADGIMEGFGMGVPLTHQEAIGWHDDVVRMKVADNGEYGDGLILTFYSNVRPEHHDVLLWCELTVDQAEALAESLMAAVRMRRMDRRQQEEVPDV